MQEIEALALKLEQGEWDEKSEAVFKSLVAQQTDAKRLREIADEYTPHTEVSIPLYERVLELNPQDISTIIALGWVLWLDGEKEKSREQLEKAKKIDAGSVEVLTLEACLAGGTESEISLYREILKRDPHNEIAQENLKKLGALDQS